MGKEEKEEGFRVTDKRLFTEDGEVKKEPERQQETPKTTPPKEPVGNEPSELPQIDFTSYVLSYYTQGLVLLGEVPNPYTDKKEEDLEAARHTIDILVLLESKTKGNLTKEEAQLLESVLYELRMKYMAKTKRIKL